MSTSAKKVAANRINGQKSQGPTNTTSTRFNATKHGLLAVGITELDDAEGYRTILNDLRHEKAPIGVVESVLVESAALDIVRSRRARRLEAEYITGELNPANYGPALLGYPVDWAHGEMLDPGLPAAISFESAQRLVSVFQRYESSFVFRLYRTLNELERLQRMRRGEKVPAPVTVDVTVHTEKETFASVPTELRQAKVLCGDGESLPRPATLDAGVHARTGTEDSALAASEVSKVPPDDEK
jgi:hypothetical protein